MRRVHVGHFCCGVVSGKSRHTILHPLLACTPALSDLRAVTFTGTGFTPFVAILLCHVVCGVGVVGVVWREWFQNTSASIIDCVPSESPHQLVHLFSLGNPGQQHREQTVLILTKEKLNLKIFMPRGIKQNTRNTQSRLKRFGGHPWLH